MERIDVTNCKNAYSFYEFSRTVLSYIFTKLFWPNSKLIRYPFFCRGKQNLKYGKGFNVGFYCRFDLLVDHCTLRIGENCNLGDYNHISAIYSVDIGDNLLTGNNVYIGDSSHGIYKADSLFDLSTPDSIPERRPIFGEAVIIGDNVWIGEHSSILPGSRIGNGCIIGANSVVNSIIPDDCIAVGCPARVVKKYNHITKIWEKV